MSWEKLLNIRDEAKRVAREESERPIVACPNCGAPLEGARGVLHCPSGDFQTTHKTGRP